MTAFAVLFTLASIGVSETAYLIQMRRSHKQPICVIGNSCTDVLNSSYSKVFGIPADVLGLIYYSCVSVLTAILVIGIPPQDVWENVMTVSVVLGSIVSLGAIYIQWRVLRAWCSWCVMSAITIFIMTGITLGINI